MPTCIYCGASKDASLFNREHVIPEAFGKFERNFVLNEVVCWDCNDYFGRHLDLQLGRQSVEGLDRYEHGVKRPDEKTKFGRGPLLKALVADGGFYDGASVWWGPSEDGSNLVLYPFPQIGFCNSERRHWFPADRVPTKEELHALGFKPGEQLELRTFGVESDEAERSLQQELEAKGYKPSKLELAQAPNQNDQVHIEIKATIDRTLQRAIAKISYNYLAYHFEKIARMEPFADIRRYIRFDAMLPSNPVSIEKAPKIDGMPKGRFPVAHALTVAWEQGQVVGRVTLFFRFQYRIVLADGGFAIAPEYVEKGHFFDPKNRRITELKKQRR